MDSTTGQQLPEVNSICHLEWQCTDHARTRRFYEGLFGWSFSEGFGGLIFCNTSKGHLGAFDLVDSVQPTESSVIYFTVEEIEPYTDRAEALGGSIFAARHEVPGVGWSARVADPDGNIIGLVKFAEKQA